MNLKDAFLSLGNYFSPKIIGKVNDQYIKVVKIKGQEVPWHNHENEDELFALVGFPQKTTRPGWCFLPPTG